MVVNVVDSELDVLSRALKSVEWADEVVVIDMTSDGKRVKEIGKEFGVKLHKHQFVDYVEPVRNFSITKTTGDWILIIDPDEEIPTSLARKLRKITNDPEADYYRLPRKNMIFGKWIEHSGWWPDYNIRFFRKDCVSWTEEIHGVPVTVGDGADVRAKEKYAIVHNNYQTIEQYIERMNRYTGRQAEGLVKKEYKFNWVDVIQRPTKEFASRYFMGRGYKDGVHGLALACLQASSELVVALKVWQIEKFKESKVSVAEVVGEMKRAEREMSYWQADTLIKSGGGIVARVKRKFKLR